jgi:hypothetical protein
MVDACVWFLDQPVGLGQWCGLGELEVQILNNRDIALKWLVHIVYTIQAYRVRPVFAIE